MSVDKENYLEYFLLFADNELNASDRKSVEEFLIVHPEFQQEFDEIQNTVLKPYDEEYTPITELTKFNGLTVQPELLLHLDGELSGAEKSAIVELIESNETVAEEWRVLNNVKLQPEQIAFPDKELLYKRTKRYVIPFPLRLAVAAMFIGAGFYFTLQLTNVNNNGSQPEIDNQLSSVNSNTTQHLASRNTNSNSDVSNEDVMVETDAAVLKNKIITDTETAETLTNSYVHAVDVVAPKNNLEKIEDQSNILDVSPVQSIENPRVFLPEEIERAPITLLASNENVSGLRERRNPYAFTADNSSIREDEVEESSEVSEVKKSGGLFNKVKRAIEKRTNIEPGGNLLIGAFEIAIK